MDIRGEYTVKADRWTVWRALNDPDVLRAAIPGCEALDRSDASRFEATVRAKVGPVTARFNGMVTLKDLEPPHAYTIAGEGKAGAAGFAKGEARVSLEEKDGSTVVRYAVATQVGGRLAQIGARMIEGTAKKVAGEFFATFAALVENGTTAATPSVGSIPASASSRRTLWVIVSIGACLAVATLWMLRTLGQ